MRHLLTAMAFVLVGLATAAAQAVVDPSVATFTPSSDHVQLVTSYRFGVFASETDTVPLLEIDLGKPAPDSTNTCSVPIYLSPLGAGSYIARIRAYAGPDAGPWSDPASVFSVSGAAILPPAPAVTQVATLSGPASGGTAVTITGAGFRAGARLVFGGTEATSVTVVNWTTVTAITPSHAAGAVDVLVMNDDGQAGALGGGFTFVAPPAVIQLTPRGGALAGGTTVSITGTGFRAGAQVTFAGVAATGVSVVSDTTITAATPGHAAGVVDVVVTNDDGQSGALVGGFTYATAPTVNGATPGIGPRFGGTVVSITGTAFRPGAVVTFGGATAASTSVTSESAITAVAPAHAAGAVDIVVTNDDGQAGALAGSFTYAAATAAAAISPGGYHTCALAAGGSVACWGDNTYGQLGDGTTTARWTATVVSGLGGDIVAITAGLVHTCAVATGGSVWCWGRNRSGQLGDETSTDRLTPTLVSGLESGVTAVVAGGNSTCALTAGGAVVCWGENDSGQLGDGTTVSRPSPAAVIGMESGVTAIAVGRQHVCALTAGGAVFCWGANGGGQLGDGTAIDRSTPAAVGGLETGVTAIAAGEGHTCALTAGGAVRCWGNNATGEVGNGTTLDQWTPGVVSGLAGGVTAIAAGVAHTCALTSSGAVRCWGGNWFGQVGDGTTVDRWTPVAVSGMDSGVSAIAAGDYHSCALTTDGNALCWGYGGFGQLGDGTATDRSRPSAVTGLWGGGALTVTRMSLTGGPVTGGSVLSIEGTGLAVGATVTFDGIPATNVMASGPAQMTATTPAHGAGAVDVVITSPDRQQATLVAGFVYRPLAPVDLLGAGKSAVAVFRGAADAWWVDGQSDPVTFGAAGDIPVVADYDGDGKAELAVYRPSTSEWIVKGQAPVVFGQAGDVPVPGDYNGDGKAEMAVFRPSTGEWIIAGRSARTFWGMKGDIPVPADYNGDGLTEIAVFRPRTGVWYVMGGETLEWGMWGDVPVPADYNGDGKAEIAVYRPSTGWWYVARGPMAPWGAPGDIPVPLDVDGDGRVEFVIFRPGDGTWYALNPATGVTTSMPSGATGDVPVGQSPQLPAMPILDTPGDFDHDGVTDITVFRPSDGGWYSLESTHAYRAFVGVTLGQAGDIPVPGDYLGIGRQERAVYRPTTGEWLLEDGRTVTLGAEGDVPVPGDYDGDGVTDIAVFTPATAQWSILTGASGFTTLLTETWGAAGDVPAPGDYDKDGMTDLAVFTPATGVWRVRSSKTGSTLIAVAFGMSGDIVVPGDYDGDGVTDIAVYRPSTGYWFVLTSSSGFANYMWYWWGAEGDVPVPGDYDGDGASDVAVYRPSTGAWYVMDQFTITGWGDAGDLPVLRRQ